MDHLIVLRSTKLEPGDTVPYNGSRYSIMRFCHDRGILLSNGIWVCRTDLDITEEQLILDYLTVNKNLSDLLHAAKKIQSQGVTIQYGVGDPNQKEHVLIGKLDYKDLKRSIKTIIKG